MSWCFLALYKLERYDILGSMCSAHIARYSLTFTCLKLLVVNCYSVSQITCFSDIYKFAIIALNYVYYVFVVTTRTLVCKLWLWGLSIESDYRRLSHAYNGKIVSLNVFPLKK